MTPKKPEWFEIVEGDALSRSVERVNKKLTLGTLIAVGAVLITGSLFANVSQEPNALANVQLTAPAVEVPAVEVPVAVKNSVPQNPKIKSVKAPSITQLPTRGGDDDEDDDDDDEDDEDDDFDLS